MFDDPWNGITCGPTTTDVYFSSAAYYIDIMQFTYDPSTATMSVNPKTDLAIGDHEFWFYTTLDNYPGPNAYSKLIVHVKPCQITTITPPTQALEPYKF